MNPHTHTKQEKKWNLFGTPPPPTAVDVGNVNANIDEFHRLLS